MANVLKRLKPKSAYGNQPSNRHDLEGAIERAGDAKDIARDMLRQLPDYDGDELEDTARHDMSPHPVHVHVHQHSQPDSDEQPSIEMGPLKAKGVPRWLATSVIVGAVIVAAVTAVVARLLAR